MLASPTDVVVSEVMAASADMRAGIVHLLLRIKRPVHGTRAWMLRVKEEVLKTGVGATKAADVMLDDALV